MGYFYGVTLILSIISQGLDYKKRKTLNPSKFYENTINIIKIGSFIGNFVCFVGICYAFDQEKDCGSLSKVILAYIIIFSIVLALICFAVTCVFCCFSIITYWAGSSANSAPDRREIEAV